MTQTETLGNQVVATPDRRLPNEIGSLAGALAKAQADITSPPRNREVTVKMKSGGIYKFKYATLDSIIDHVRGPLTANGLWFTQTLEGDDNGKYRLITALIHSSGQSIKSETPLLVVESGNQAFGSALTYMRRYALCSILGVAADEDDDANSAEGNAATSKSAGAKWRGPLAVTKLKAAFGEFVKDLHGCKNVEDITVLVTNYSDVLDQLRVDKPEWYNGAGDVEGVDDRVQARKRAVEVEPDPFTVLTINSPIEGDWRAKLEAALDNCPDVEAVNKLALANVGGMGKYKKIYPDKVQDLMDLFAKKRGALELAPNEGEPS